MLRLAVLLCAATCSPAFADLDFLAGGRPYRLITTERSFADAETDAVSKGGHLVHIDSKAENDDIFAAISAAVPSGSTSSDGGGSIYVWIGGTETTEGTYAWMDSQATAFWSGGKNGAAANGSYVNWGRNPVGSIGPEPDNFNGNQNRVAMAITAWPLSSTSKTGTPGQWNDIRSNNTLAYVIEFGGTYFNVEGRPYGLITTLRTFANAEADAVSKGGHLVHIDSQAENDAILAAITAAVPSGSTSSDGGDSRYVWIGGTEASEGTYAWMDSQATAFWTGGKTGAVAAGAFANWGPNIVGTGGPEPDNSNSTQNRAAMAITAWPNAGADKIGQPGQWNDISDSNTLAYVVEYDGLYTTMVMSHAGVNKPPFTAKLHFDKVPMTVGNFMGLAEGTRDFIDEKSGFVNRRPYYNNLISHRIIAGFMIQTGCPRGDGTGGPGYSFLDEFDATLRHSKAGIFSMANSGPNTNGSQFFITVAPATHLDDKHSVFGEVISGLNETVIPLSQVPVNGSTPQQTVRIESMTFHRAGTAARAFNPVHPNLPTVTGVLDAQVSMATNHCILNYPRKQHCSYELLQTGDLRTWTLSDESLSIESFGPVPNAAEDTFPLVPAGSNQRFFRVAEVQYPYPIYAPLTVTGKKVTVVDPTLATFAHNLPTESTGNYVVTTPPPNSQTLTGQIGDYFWERTPHGAQFICYIGGSLSVGGTGIYYLSYQLRFTAAESGTVRGSLQNISRTEVTPVSGTFTLGNLP